MTVAISWIWLIFTAFFNVAFTPVAELAKTFTFQSPFGDEVLSFSLQGVGEVFKLFGSVWDNVPFILAVLGVFAAAWVAYLVIDSIVGIIFK